MAITNTKPSLWALNVREMPGFHIRRDTDPLVPKLGGFLTYYGVQVSAIGDDGDLVALGHVGKLRALAAFNRVAREVWGNARDHGNAALYDGEGQPDQVVDSVRHTWMTNDRPADDWWMRKAHPDDPGAFPVTYWSAY